MTSISEIRAVPGMGTETAADYERAAEDVSSFVDKINEIWDENVLPRAIEVGVKPMDGRRYEDDPRFVITKDQTDSRTSISIWNKTEARDGYELNLDPMVIQRDSEGVTAYEVPDSHELYEGTEFTINLSEDKSKIVLYKSFWDFTEEHLLDHVSRPLLEKEVKFVPLDLVAVSYLISRIDLSYPTIFDWRDYEDDPEY